MVRGNGGAYMLPPTGWDPEMLGMGIVGGSDCPKSIRKTSVWSWGPAKELLSLEREHTLASVIAFPGMEVGGVGKGIGVRLPKDTLPSPTRERVVPELLESSSCAFLISWLGDLLTWCWWHTLPWGAGMRSGAMISLVVAAGGKVELGCGMPPCIMALFALLVGMMVGVLMARGTSGPGPVYFRTL